MLRRRRCLPPELESAPGEPRHAVRFPRAAAVVGSARLRLARPGPSVSSAACTEGVGAVKGASRAAPGRVLLVEPAPASLSRTHSKAGRTFVVFNELAEGRRLSVLPR